MTGRQRRRAPPKPEPPPGGLLDWRDASHWSWTEKPCRYCDKPTQLRDSKRSPAHKTCAEAALQQQAAEAADAYHREGHTVQPFKTDDLPHRADQPAPQPDPGPDIASHDPTAGPESHADTAIDHLH